MVGDAADGDEAITQTLELQPDILLLDVSMPRLPGLEAMRAIMNGPSTAKILLLTSTITTQQIIEALHIGARGIVLKDALASHLQTAIRTVFAGDYWIGGKRVVNLVSALHDLMQQAAVRSAKPTASRRASLKWWVASWKAAATATSPSNSPSAKKPSSGISPTSSTRPACRRGWNWRSSPSRTIWSRRSKTRVSKKKDVLDASDFGVDFHGADRAERSTLFHLQRV